MPHREPEPDWIGNMPVEHGESDHPVPDTGGWNGLYTESPDMFCLCGHPNYMTCPMWPRGDVGGWTIERRADGGIGIAGDLTGVGAPIGVTQEDWDDFNDELAGWGGLH